MTKIADINNLLAEVARQKKLKGLNNDDIAKITGYKLSSVNAFTSGFRHSQNMATAVCSALDIKMPERELSNGNE